MTNQGFAAQLGLPPEMDGYDQDLIDEVQRALRDKANANEVRGVMFDRVFKDHDQHFFTDLCTGAIYWCWHLYDVERMNMRQAIVKAVDEVLAVKAARLIAGDRGWYNSLSPAEQDELDGLLRYGDEMNEMLTGGGGRGQRGGGFDRGGRGGYREDNYREVRGGSSYGRGQRGGGSILSSQGSAAALIGGGRRPSVDRGSETVRRSPATDRFGTGIISNRAARNQPVEEEMAVPKAQPIRLTRGAVPAKSRTVASRPVAQTATQKHFIQETTFSPDGDVEEITDFTDIDRLGAVVAVASEEQTLTKFDQASPYNHAHYASSQQSVLKDYGRGVVETIEPKGGDVEYKNHEMNPQNIAVLLQDEEPVKAPVWAGKNGTREVKSIKAEGSDTVEYKLADDALSLVKPVKIEEETFFAPTVSDAAQQAKVWLAGKGFTGESMMFTHAIKNVWAVEGEKETINAILFKESIEEFFDDLKDGTVETHLGAAFVNFINGKLTEMAGRIVRKSMSLETIVFDSFKEDYIELVKMVKNVASQVGADLFIKEMNLAFANLLTGMEINTVNEELRMHTLTLVTKSWVLAIDRPYKDLDIACRAGKHGIKTAMVSESHTPALASAMKVFTDAAPADTHDLFIVSNDEKIINVMFGAWVPESILVDLPQ